MFKAGDVVEYRGLRKEYFGKQFTIKMVYTGNKFYHDYAHVVETTTFAPHLKNLIYVNVSLENE